MYELPTNYHWLIRGSIMWGGWKGFSKKYLFRGVSRIFSWGQIPFVGRRAEIFSSGTEFPHPLKNLPLGHNRQEGGGEYLTMTNERLVLASAPMPSIRAFFIRGRNISFWISPGAYVPYAPQLDMFLFLFVIRQYVCFY